MALVLKVLAACGAAAVEAWPVPGRPTALNVQAGAGLEFGCWAVGTREKTQANTAADSGEVILSKIAFPF
jgi:hypothetical protein